MKYLFWVFLLFITTSLLGKAPVLSSKELTHPPSNVIRTCCSFGFDLSVARIPFVKKTDITDIYQLGNHHYLGNETEGNGIIYTQRGGFIDIGHLRDYADWTAYLYNVILSSAENQQDIIIDLGSEGGTKTLIIPNPHEIDPLLYAELAGKIAYDLSVWHEIATWFGASYIPMIPERYSSFSPEDLYSNLLGIKLGILAIESDLEYDEAMTSLLEESLYSLETVTSSEETYSAMEAVEDIWWTRKKPLPSGKVLLARYLDSDSALVPWLLPNADLEGDELQKPNSDLMGLYEIRIDLHKNFALETLDAEHINRTITQYDFSWMIDCVDARQKEEEIKTAEKIAKSTLRKEQRNQ